jgi:hypothetical protein
MTSKGSQSISARMRIITLRIRFRVLANAIRWKGPLHAPLLPDQCFNVSQ